MERDGGERQNNNILLDVQYHLKTFLPFIFLIEELFQKGSPAPVKMFII